MPTLYMVQNDTAPSPTITIKRGQTVVDLTGSTVKLKIKNNDTGSRTNDAHNTCSLVSPAAGQVSYTFLTGDLPDATSYSCDVEITYPNGHIETAGPTDPLIIVARAEA